MKRATSTPDIHVHRINHNSPYAVPRPPHKNVSGLAGKPHTTQRRSGELDLKTSGDMLLEKLYIYIYIKCEINMCNSYAEILGSQMSG